MSTPYGGDRPDAGRCPESNGAITGIRQLKRRGAEHDLNTVTSPVHLGGIADFIGGSLEPGSWITGITSLILSLVAAYFARRINRAASAEAEIAVAEESLTDRIEGLRSNLKQSTVLMDEINAELGLRTAALDRIRQEAEENRRLAALHADEAEAVKNLVASTIEGARAQADKPAKRQQWLFFLAGLFFSIPLGVGVNFLYDLITH
jgi:hypothetical protein